MVPKIFTRGPPGTRAAGIAAVAFTLAPRLPSTAIHLGAPFRSVEANAVVTNLAHYHGRHVLVATDPTSAHHLVGSRDVAWHSQTTRWWSLPRREASNQLRVDI